MTDEGLTRPVPLVIIGAGGHGREALDVVEAMNKEAHQFDFLGFLDDGLPDLDLLARRGVKLLGPSTALARLDASYVIGIGSSDTRRRLDEFATSIGRKPARLVHPSATIGADVSLGAGTVVCAHVSVTTNITVGRHVHVGLNSTIAHDAVLGDYVTIMPGATISGNVKVGAAATIGANATVIQGLEIGPEAFVGAGAAVVRPVLPGITVGGVPARPLNL